MLLKFSGEIKAYMLATMWNCRALKYLIILLFPRQGIRFIELHEFDEYHYSEVLVLKDRKVWQLRNE